MSFVHLHVHSHYSLLNALPKIPDLVAKAKKERMTALALTDSGNLYGAIEFYQECRKNEIKPIIGLDAYLALRSRADKQTGVDNQRFRLVLLAKNLAGYKNLIKLVTAGYLEGFYYKPRIDRELLKQYKNDLIAIAPSFSSEISFALKNGDMAKAKELISWYKETFGLENFYLEITHHPEITGHEDLMQSVEKLAKETDTPLVAAHDVYYLKPDDAPARDTLLSIQSGQSIKERSAAFDNTTEDFSFITATEARKIFSHQKEALANTEKIAAQCNLEIPLGIWKFPNYVIESGRTPDEEFRHLVYEGVKNRNMALTTEIKERIEYELEVIKNKGYAKYFLVVADLLKFAREHHILSNTRGSAAGSLVSYLTGITIVDPIVLNLPFERFLNPERPSAPDIDMDFADDRRDEVIEYVRNKYGADHVAQIGTFGTMMARGSVRDTARALGFPYTAGDKIAKLIPFGAQGFPMTIERALKEVPELKELIKNDPDSKQIIEMAKKIEGCARHIGVHAAGVVISPDPLTEDVPIQYDPKGEGKLITQYDMHSVGEDGVGLLKFDFLGLKNLTIMANTIKLAAKIYNKKIDTDQIPLDDKKTYAMLARGETAATFQLNGAGMTRFLKDLKPTNINDINAMVALYRPGPMAFIPDYIERKHQPEKVKYLDNRFKALLEPTYGILIYQDDIMLIAVNFAGYSWGEADKFRKAMGKKIPAVMAAQKEKFIKGCLEVGGLSEKQTKDLWESIETFAAYGFNKAHSASYGRIAYLTSYLKANYPVLYMAAVLTADQGDIDKIAEMITECKRMKIDVLPPSINESFADFTVIPDTDQIRFGLTTIKNFGAGIAQTIIDERKRGGKFKNLADFLERVTDRNLNKKSLEALIKCGALDDFGDRGVMLANLDKLLAFNKEAQRQDGKQDSLFGLMDNKSSMPNLTLSDSAPASSQEKLTWEKELLGLYISGHPLEQYREKLANQKISIKNLKEQGKEGLPAVIAGIVEEIKPIMTKSGDRMIFARIADFSDKLEVVVFPRVLQEYATIFVAEQCIAIKGKISKRNGEVSLIADKAKILT